MKTTRQEWAQFARAIWIITKNDILPFVMIAGGAMAAAIFLSKNGDEVKKDFGVKQQIMIQNEKQRD